MDFNDAILGAIFSCPFFRTLFNAVLHNNTIVLNCKLAAKYFDFYTFEAIENYFESGANLTLLNK